VVQRDHTAVVTVTDSGIGIAAQDLPGIFDMFGQVESASHRSQGGQGIGLSLAKGLVEMHGGSIAAFSEGEGRGCRFEVVLPLVQPTREPGASVVRDAATPQAGLRILVADDLPDAADSLALLLQAMGHTVDVAYDGEQALRRAEDLRPDVVLLDLGMPRLTGYEVCRRIRAAPWGAGTVLIAQSGWGRAHDRARTHQAGFDHHVVKPVQAEALTQLFRR
jgi:CheY-like chemotaxis protein